MPASVGKHREVVLALPLSRLLVKVIRVPEESLGDVDGYVLPVLKAMSPFPDEPLSVSCETLRETEKGRIVLAVAVPEGSLDDVATALDAANLNITRIIPQQLGRLPGILAKFRPAEKRVRRLLLIGGSDCLSVFVLDDDLIVDVRAVSPGGDISREIMLSLLAAEAFNGPGSVGQTVGAGDFSGWEIPSSPLYPPLEMLEDAAGGSSAAAEDAQGASSIDALPRSWRDVLDETRFKRKMTFFFSCALFVLVVALAVLAGVPQVYKSRTSRSKAGRAEQTKNYDRVKAKKDQVDAVKSISDRSRGGLETIRAVVSTISGDSLQSIHLDRWDFRRNNKLTIRGWSDGDNQRPVFRLKEALSAITLDKISGREDDAGIPFFTKVDQTKKNQAKNGRWDFEFECSFADDEEEGGM